MSEEEIDDTGCVVSQGTNPEEQCSDQEPPHTDDATPDELFESFMEIANNCELHNEQTDMQKDTTGEAIGASDPSVGEVEDITSSANGQKDAVSDQEMTNAAYDSSISQHTDINSSSDEPQTDMLNGTNDQSATTETGKKNTPNGTPDQGESTATDVSDSILSQATDVNSGTCEQSTCAQTSSNVETLDSTACNTTDGQSNSDDSAVQNVTEGPVASCEQVLGNPVCDETKPEEQGVTTDSLQSSSDITNEVHRTEELSCGTENLEEGAESSEVQTTDNKKTSPESTEVDVDCAVLSDEPLSENDPSTSEADVAKRLSKAMMDLAGLEEQLSSAVTELKRSSSEKKIEESSDGKELHAITETREGQIVENQMDGHVASDTTVMDTAETKVQDELVVNKGAADEGSNDMSVHKTDGKAAVGETDVDFNAVNVDSSNEESLVENTDKIDRDTVHVDNDHSDSKGTDVDVVEPQELKMEDSATDDQVIPTNEAIHVPTNEDTKVESNVVGKSETPDAEVNTGQTVDEKEEESHEESHGETIPKDSNYDTEEKSDCVDELDMEVTKACTSIPDIEITTDESGISENKSLDSMDTEGSSYMSEDGIDSDTPSDYGDDDDDGTFDPDNLGASRRKSWLLETDRNRLSSDSSTVSERDFKESYDKGDNADGKSPKDDYIRGHLLKMGGTGFTPKNWRKRWFVLRRDNCLYYYKQSKDKVPCGVIILANYSVSKAPEVNKNHCLKLTKGGARTYYMCAGSDLDMKKWIMAMTDAIKGSSGSSNPFNLFEGNVHNVSIPALSIRDPDCHGYLYKQGHNIKTWRRRYFVLKNGFLYYYSDMSNNVALGVAKLLNYTIQVGDQTGKKFCFSAVSSETSLRTYFLAAESEMDRTRWLSKLEESIKKGSLVNF